jgi:hypothetical protein
VTLESSIFYFFDLFFLEYSAEVSRNSSEKKKKKKKEKKKKKKSEEYFIIKDVYAGGLLLKPAISSHKYLLLQLELDP